MSDKPFLKFGSKGLDVARLVKLLESHGCTPSPQVTASSPRFGRAIENMVMYFQMTHLNTNGNWLDVDGQVGKNTWLALEHGDDDAQRSHLKPVVPEGIEGNRKAILETAIGEHGIREDTGRKNEKGEKLTNRGKDVDKYLPNWVTSDPTTDGQPWCAYFISWVVKEVYGRHLLGRPVARVWKAYERASKEGRWTPKGAEVPTPGDAFVLLYDDEYTSVNCTGHIGFVLQVSEDGRSYNTIEGNCADRVKVGQRTLDDPTLRGFINIVGDKASFTRGSLRGAKNVDSKRTR